MLKKTFKYCATHKADEAYMQLMCSHGWAAIKLVEGFWTFEQCEPNQYCYRIGYLRGMKQNEIESMKKELASKDIEFVSNYSFWAIFRSTKKFELYNYEDEYAICQKMYAPMPIGALVSLLLAIIGCNLTFRISGYFIIPTFLIGVYGLICIWLALAYHKLLKDLAKSNKKAKLP